MKRIFSLIILINIFIFNLAYSQVSDSLNLRNCEFLKTGKFAVVFELGTIIGKSSTIERYNFLAKYHIYNNFAVRVGGDIGKSVGEASSSHPASCRDFSSFSYDIYADFQYYFTRKSMVKPFVTLGTFYSRDRLNYLEYDGDYLYRNQWNLGITSTLGIEIFLINNVSLVSEYIAKCYYSSTEEKNIINYYSNFNGKSKIVKFSVNTFRIGASVYF